MDSKMNVLFKVYKRRPMKSWLLRVADKAHIPFEVWMKIKHCFIIILSSHTVLWPINITRIFNALKKRKQGLNIDGADNELIHIFLGMYFPIIFRGEESLSGCLQCPSYCTINGTVTTFTYGWQLADARAIREVNSRKGDSSPPLASFPIGPKMDPCDPNHIKGFLLSSVGIHQLPLEVYWCNFSLPSSRIVIRLNKKFYNETKQKSRYLHLYYLSLI